MTEDSTAHLYSILRRKQVQARIGLSRSTMYDRIKTGTFPKPVALARTTAPPPRLPNLGRAGLAARSRRQLAKPSRGLSRA